MLFNIYPPPPHVIEKYENLSLFHSSFIFLIHHQLRFFIALHPIR